MISLKNIKTQAIKTLIKVGVIVTVNMAMAQGAFADQGDIQQLATQNFANQANQDSEQALPWTVFRCQDNEVIHELDLFGDDGLFVYEHGQSGEPLENNERIGTVATHQGYFSVSANDVYSVYLPIEGAWYVFSQDTQDKTGSVFAFNPSDDSQDNFAMCTDMGSMLDLLDLEGLELSAMDDDFEDMYIHRLNQAIDKAQ